MRKISVFAIGIIVGAIASHFVMSITDILDEGVSQTYRCDQLAREEDARRSAEKIIQQFLVDKNLADLEIIANTAGLKMQHFEKLDKIEVVVGHRAETATLNFTVTYDGDITVGKIPGNTLCDGAVFERAG